VLFYKPWRRRIDKKRVSDAHFEPLSQDLETNEPQDEEQRTVPQSMATYAKDVDVSVEPVEATDVAGSAHR
jgi:high-affinity nickel-transport protein